MAGPSWLHNTNTPVGKRPRLPTAASSFTSVSSTRSDADVPTVVNADGEVYIELSGDKDVCVKDGVLYVGGEPAAAAGEAKEVVAATATAAVDGAAQEQKEQREVKKKVKEYMKTALSSERTFFKWVWTGLQFGALGTFVFVSFVDEGPPLRLILVATCWLLGFSASVYGLLQYHRRRRALMQDNPDPRVWESPAAPGVIVALFFGLIVAILTYAIVTEQHHLSAGVGAKAAQPPSGA